MKHVISISVELDQAQAIKQLIESTHARSASDLIRQALRNYAKEHSPTLAHHFNDKATRHNANFTGKGTPAHPDRRRRRFMP